MFSRQQAESPLSRLAAAHWYQLDGGKPISSSNFRNQSNRVTAAGGEVLANARYRLVSAAER